MRIVDLVSLVPCVRRGRAGRAETTYGSGVTGFRARVRRGAMIQAPGSSRDDGGGARDGRGGCGSSEGARQA